MLFVYYQKYEWFSNYLMYYNKLARKVLLKIIFYLSKYSLQKLVKLNQSSPFSEENNSNKYYSKTNVALYPFTTQNLKLFQ